MKAYVLHKIGDIRLEDVETPFPGKGEVLVKVRAAGINNSDIKQIYEESVSFPLIPGHEFSGEVEDIGEEVDPDWLHKRVGVCPILPCGVCPSCQKGRYDLCMNYGYLGSEKNGGFAEFAVVPVNNLLQLPKDVSYEEAAVIEPLAAAVHMIRKTKPTSDDKVVIYGIDIMSILLWMCLKDAGVKNVYIIGNGGMQKQILENMGLALQDYSECKGMDLTNWSDQCTKGKDVNVFYECTGKNEVFSQVVDMMAPMGKICLVGKPHSDVKLSRDAYEKIRRNQLILEGSWNSLFNGKTEDDWHYVLDKLSKKKFLAKQLISRRYSVDNLMQGFQWIKKQSGGCEKIMMENPLFF